MSVIDRFRINGKVAFITGGSRGLGKAMAESIADAGANVAISSRHLEDCVKTAEEISNKTGKEILPLKIDVKNAFEIEEGVKKTIKKFGKIDILITSAGINYRYPAEEFPEEKFREVMEINFFGTQRTCQIVGREMIKRKYGRIITIGSMLSLVSIPGRTAYTSSKAGVLQFTRTIALEWAKYNITANCVCPGPFDTEMNREIFKNPEIKKFFLDNVPLGRFGELEEIGSLAVFLSSDACPYITGDCILIDGGWTIA